MDAVTEFGRRELRHGILERFYPLLFQHVTPRAALAAHVQFQEVYGHGHS
jgi:hypothetical protein